MTWFPSLCFRRFREKHTELSKIYWTHELGVENLKNTLRNSNKDDQVVNAAGVVAFPIGMFPYTVEQTLGWLEIYLNRARLHLLVICSANLEAYLQDVTALYLLSKGYGINFAELSDVGEALGAPILKKDSLPEPLKYAQKLFDVDYGQHLSDWNRAYKLRCAAAHNGGIVEPRTIKEIPDIGIDIGKMIGITWEELRPLLASAEQIATITDQKISSYELLKVEVIKLLTDLKENNQLQSFRGPQNATTRQSLWGDLSLEFKIQGIKRKDKFAIEEQFFPLRPPTTPNQSYRPTPKVLEGLGRLTKAVSETPEFSTDQRKELIEQLNELRSQAELLPEKRSSGLIKPVFNELRTQLSATALSTMWDDWGVKVIGNFLGIS